MAIVKEKKAAVEISEKLQNENGKVDMMVDLMEKWWRACEAMGSRMMAVHACSDFKQFLERKEKNELKHYKKDQAASSSSNSSIRQDEE